MEHLKDDLKIIFQCFGSDKSRIKKVFKYLAKVRLVFKTKHCLRGVFSQFTSWF